MQKRRRFAISGIGSAVGWIIALWQAPGMIENAPQDAGAWYRACAFVVRHPWLAIAANLSAVLVVTFWPTRSDSDKANDQQERQDSSTDRRPARLDDLAQPERNQIVEWRNMIFHADSHFQSRPDSTREDVVKYLEDDASYRLLMQYVSTNRIRPHETDADILASWSEDKHEEIVRLTRLVDTIEFGWRLDPRRRESAERSENHVHYPSYTPSVPTGGAAVAARLAKKVEMYARAAQRANEMPEGTTLDDFCAELTTDPEFFEIRDYMPKSDPMKITFGTRKLFLKDLAGAIEKWEKDQRLK